MRTAGAKVSGHLSLLRPGVERFPRVVLHALVSSRARKAMVAACAKSFGSTDGTASAGEKSVTIRLSVTEPGAMHGHGRVRPDRATGYDGDGGLREGAAGGEAARCRAQGRWSGPQRAGRNRLPWPLRVPADFDVGTVVRFTATPGPGNDFAGFGGRCSGPSCSVMIEGDQQIWATFKQRAVTLSLSVTGGGRSNRFEPRNGPARGRARRPRGGAERARRSSRRGAGAGGNEAGAAGGRRRTARALAKGASQPAGARLRRREARRRPLALPLAGLLPATRDCDPSISWR